jgi:hypothetical protein
MSIFDQKTPAYIYTKQNLIKLIFFTALFALVFINIYKPFSSESWYGVSKFKFLVYSSLIILTGVLVAVVSRIVMYYWGRSHSIGLGAYLLWVLFEIFFMALFYTFYTSFLNPERDYIEVFEESLVNTSLVLLLPYVVLHLYFSYRDKDNQLQQLEEEIRHTAPAQSVYSFYDEKGELQLSVAKDHLLYVASADNYVEIWYLNKEAPTRLVVRNSLTSVEKSFANTNVVRSHRSYMVNLEAVKVIRRQKEGIFMEFGVEHVPNIPVSDRYSAKITSWFTK